MNFWGFGKKKETATTEVAKKNVSKEKVGKKNGGEEKVPGRNETKAGGNCVMVLGSGCKLCHTLFENTQQAVKEMDQPLKTAYVTDIKETISYGVTSTPALVLNGKVISMGKVLKVPEIIALLRKEGC